MNFKKEIIKEELICLDLDAENSVDAMDILANLLYEKGYVKQSYIQAVKQREEVYPTGLPTEPVGIAIPHADAVHVKKGALCIGILKNPVKFQIMGMPEESIDVELIFMMAIDNPDEHLATLQRLMEIFQDKDILKKIKESTSIKEITEIINNFFENFHK